MLHVRKIKVEMEIMLLSLILEYGESSGIPG